MQFHHDEEVKQNCTGEEIDFIEKSCLRFVDAFKQSLEEADRLQMEPDKIYKSILSVYVSVAVNMFGSFHKSIELESETAIRHVHNWANGVVQAYIEGYHSHLLEKH